MYATFKASNLMSLSKEPMKVENGQVPRMSFGIQQNF